VNDFYPGQRWISDAEIEFGIGTVLTMDARTVTILYRAVMETRVYSLQNAPLTRVRFDIDQQLHDVDGQQITVKKIKPDQHGLITYIGLDQDGEHVILPESRIDHHLPVREPDSRLMSGQTDNPRWFTLRLQARQFEGLIWQSPVRGLQGARMELVPHQLYIANEIASRENARALLADEVGLGKTIEACLVLHRRIIQGRCSRALIIVPQSLVNQWLVELLRRFNLAFSVYDEDRCRDIESSEPGVNPFEHAQLVLTALPLLQSPARLEQATSIEWDMLIVDEAHHLHWTETQAGDDYRVVEKLAQLVPSVLLLTATPEQLGLESHFARLRLLDPERFNNLQQFREQEKTFEPVADLAEAILEAEVPDDDLVARLAHYGIDSDSEKLLVQKTDIARQLIDLHGTSRLLFRNTRQNIHGFPERKLMAYALRAQETVQPPAFSDAVFDQLLQDDPRIPWLIEQVRQLRPNKLLVICSRAELAIRLQDILQRNEGIRCGVFHEDMTIVQRDRAAAWFAESDGAEILFCSEIGSEGRNFQFAHHLVLFDLPLNPDLLEQRIGRLDRIGQHETIYIHVPWIEQTAHEKLFHWHRDVTGLFTRTNPVAAELFEETEAALRQVLLSEDDQVAHEFLQSCKTLNDELQEKIRHGRERLLSLSSFRESQAKLIVDSITQLDHDKTLQPFMEQVFDLYGLETEEHSSQRQVVRPGDHMISAHFPHVHDDGTLITYDRQVALAHEDTQFLNWDHPMVTGAIDLVTGGESGNSSLSVVRHDSITTGTSFLELLYVIESHAPAHLPVRRFFKQPVIRLLLDVNGNDLASVYPHESLTTVAMEVNQAVAQQAIKAQSSQIQTLLGQAQQLVGDKGTQIRSDAMDEMENALDIEITRLKVLQKNNPNIQDRDIELLEQQRNDMRSHIHKASIRLDAIRLVVISD
jgi:ATP-dependent helicase HepA